MSYMVCDRCGLFWEIEDDEPDPTECAGFDCRHQALWRFPTLEPAWAHSDMILSQTAGVASDDNALPGRFGSIRAITDEEGDKGV